MANIEVQTSSSIVLANRVSVRTSGDRVYAFVSDGDNIRAKKGNQNGRPDSFSTITSLGVIGLLNGGVACAIDSSNIIHIVCYVPNTAHLGVLEIVYVTFDTSDDTFGSKEQVFTMNNDGNSRSIGIALDANDDPHVFWKDALSNMGTLTTQTFYSNRIEGVTSSIWDKTPITPLNSNNNDNEFTCHDIMIADPLSSVNADRPILITISDPNNMIVQYGNALNAVSFPTFTDVTGSILVSSGAGNKISFAIDSNEKITVVFVETTSLDLMIVEHLNSNDITNWETPVNVDTTKDFFKPSIAINGTDRVILVESVSDNDLRLFEDTGSGFNEVTGEQDLPNVGTFDTPILKWASKNLNSPTKMDYLFMDGTTVRYNEFDTTFVPPSGAEPEYATIIG